MRTTGPGAARPLAFLGDGMNILRPGLLLLVIVLGWQAAVVGWEIPRYLLPAPSAIATVFWLRWELLAEHGLVTVAEIILGLLVALVLASCLAFVMALSQGLSRLLLPMVLVSQAIPVFALAPLLVLWLGYGLASKVAMAALIIFFPLTSNLYEGLKSTPSSWLSLAKNLTSEDRPQKWRVFWHLRLPAALPHALAGFKVSVTLAPIGAVIGEWVGSSAGLGYLMLHANGRMQIDLMFAALSLLAALTLCLYYGSSWLIARLMPPGFDQISKT